MWIQFEVDFIGDTELIAGCARFERSLSAFQVPLYDSAERAAASNEENIVRGGIPNRFAPLSPSTLYASLDRMGGPLYNHGHLLAGATDLGQGAEGSGYSLTDDEVHIGLDPDTEVGQIGVWMAEGNEEQHRQPRPFMRVLDSDVEAVGDFFFNYVEDEIALAFGGGF